MPPPLWMFCVGMFFCTYSFGQNKSRLAKSLSLGKIKVNAQCEYDIVKGDTLLNGKLSVKHFGVDSLSPGLSHYLSVDGSFTAHVPDKAWQFQVGKFQVDDKPTLLDYHLRLKVSGIYHRAKVNFHQGKAHGKWTHIVERLDKSVSKKIHFKSNIRFKEGVPNGILTIKDSSHTLLGRFLQNGFAHDVWELNFEKTPENVEKWHFKDGILTKISVGRGQNISTLPIYKGKIQQIKTVNLDHRYLQILALQSLYDSTAYAKKGGHISSLIQKNAWYNHKIKSIFTGLKSVAKGASMPILRVKVAHYPLKPKELEQVAEIKSNYQKIIETSQALRQNTKLNILKYAQEEVLFLLSTVQEITQNYLAAVAKVVAYDNQRILDFWPRNNMQQQLGFNDLPSPSIKVSYKDSSGTKTKTFIGPQSTLLQSQPFDFGYLANLSKYSWLCIDSIARRLNKKLRDEKIQQELVGLEKTLLSQANQLDKFIDSVQNQLPARFQATLRVLRKTAHVELRQYSSNQDLASKPGQAQTLTTCLKSLKALVISLSQLPDRWTKIKKLYTEQVWNPFTATIMNDQIKERLTQAYHQLLIPSILKSIGTDLKCENTEKHRKMLDTLYQKMQELRKKNTTRLERKLRREKNPATVLGLFGISM